MRENRAGKIRAFYARRTRADQTQNRGALPGGQPGRAIFPDGKSTHPQPSGEAHTDAHTGKVGFSVMQSRLYEGWVFGYVKSVISVIRSENAVMQNEKIICNVVLKKLSKTGSIINNSQGGYQ